HLSYICRAFCRITLDHFEDQLIKLFWRGGIDTKYGWKRLVQIGIIGHLIRQAMMQRCAQAVDIRACIALGVANLWSHVAERAESLCIAALAWLEVPRDTEVNQNHLPIRANHNIGRLEVTKNDRLMPVMQIIEDIAELNRIIQGHQRLQRSPHSLHTLMQRLPLDKLHHEVGAPAFLKGVVHAGQVRMLNKAQDSGFTFKAFPGLLQVFLVQAALLQLFNRYDSSGDAAIRGLVNGSHTAPARPLDNFVAFL